MWLRTLGSAEIAPDAEAPPALGAGKPVALLTYLAASGRTATRSVLQSLLWADLEPDAARHALRQALWYLRRKLGPDIVAADSETVTLGPHVRVDRDALLAASAAGDHDLVAERYTGPFVPGFAAPGGAGFEEWAALERRRLLEVFRHAVELIVSARVASGRARDAIDLAKRLRDYDLYNENGWRLLLDACASAADLLTAKKEAEALQQLAEQDDLELEPATRAAIRHARAASTTNGAAVNADEPAPQVPVGSLVGREEHFASLLYAWDRARAGATVRIHLTARPGIGKTRLLTDFAARIRALRAKVVTAGGRIGARDIPCAAAGDLSEGLAALAGRQSISAESAATLVALNPALSTWFERPARHADSNDALRSRTLALRELVRSATFEHPVAILLDDLHWWDEESSTLLAAVIDGLGDARLLLVSTGRPEARRAPLVSGPATQHLMLESLTASQIEELFLSIARAPAEPWAVTFPAELWRASRGSPLLALEMLQLLEQRQLLRRELGAWVSSRPEALAAELATSDVLQARLEELDRGDRWILLLLATAGTPLDLGDLTVASERPGAEVEERLMGLDARGLVIRTGTLASVAHDEIGDEVLRHAGHEATARAALRLGTVLASEAGFNENRARRAGQLLRTAGPDVQAELVHRFAAHRYAAGDRRAPAGIARELFGGQLSATDEAAVSRRLPWTWRLGLVSAARRRVALLAAGAVAAFGIARGMLPSAAAPPDAVLGIAVVDTSGNLSFFQAEIRDDAWLPNTPITTTRWPDVAGYELSSGSPRTLTWDPVRAVLYTAEASEEGTIDLFARQGARAPVRLAGAPGDDGMPSLSPDGTRLAFSTARWDTLSRYDIAVYRFADSSVTQLTSGLATDAAPVWARDGERIAFSRNNWLVQPNELCVVAERTRATSCTPLDSGHWAYVQGWLDDDRVLYVEFSRGSQELRVLQVSTGARETMFAGPASSFATPSPDGRWAFCICPFRPGREPEPILFPISAPYLARRVVLSADVTGLPRAFWISSRSNAAVARVTIHRGLDSLPVGVASQLLATVEDGRGNDLRDHAQIRWWVRDTSAARIDPTTGVLTPLPGAGRVIVHASVGRSASDSIVIDTYSPDVTVRLDESWLDPSLAEWIPYGKPEPRIVTSRGRRAFLNNGEGSFTSGAVTRRSFDGRHGLTVDAEISALVNKPQWQTLGLMLREQLDTTRVRRSLGHNVDPDIGGLATCGVGFPGEDQVVDGKVISMNHSGGSYSIAATPSWLDGTWHSIRVQLFPDGRCGLALDGRPIVVLPAGRRVSASYRLNLLGNSRWTEMLIGRVVVREGVATDMDWSRRRG
ncbi:MAG: AAA family ATPase [Gemmatimonadaceae bacterium]|nr:AAA family ATPase [Gemmatimonadaceae bacterium]